MASVANARSPLSGFSGGVGAFVPQTSTSHPRWCCWFGPDVSHSPFSRCVDLTAVFVSMVTAPGNSSAAFAAWFASAARKRTAWSTSAAPTPMRILGLGRVVRR